MSRNIRLVAMITVLGIVLLAMSACQPLVVEEEAMADADLRKVQGEIYLPAVPQWGGVTVSLDFDLVELDLETHEAAGTISWHNVMPNPKEGAPTWKGVESEARYVFFSEDAGDENVNAAVVITQIVSKDGWGQGEPGQHAYFWVRDGGDTDPDQWGMRYFSFDPFQEFFPEDSPPIEAGYFTLEDMQSDGPVLPLDVELGDIEIVHPAMVTTTE